MVEILGRSSKIKEAILLASDLARTDITVLITGESGTGKEVFAKYIHQNGLRAKKPFIAINCGAISQSILESELFGHEKGAFTGAVATRRGYFESANEGSIFLDEVGEMPLDTQVKFLRTLESGEFQRVGSSEMLRTNARIIAATNRSLEQLVTQKKFRGDLYFRLRVATIYLPPLRERREDILLLTEKFVREFETKYHVKFLGFENEATQELLNYNYPGNIRELRNLIETLVALEHKHQVTLESLSKHLSNMLSFPPVVVETGRTAFENEEWSKWQSVLQAMQMDIREIKDSLRAMKSAAPNANRYLLPSAPESLSGSANTLRLADLEKQAITQALKATNGNKRQASLKLGITERTLYRKIKEYGIDNIHRKRSGRDRP